MPARNVVSLPLPGAQVLARAPRSQGRARTDGAANRETARQTLVDEMRRLQQSLGMTISASADRLREDVLTGRAAQHVLAAARIASQGGKRLCPARARLIAHAGHAAQGESLTDNYAGRARTIYPWEARAAYHYAKPTRPPMSVVALWLIQEGWPDVTETRVRRYLNRLPSHQAETSPRRVGRHYYNQNIRPHVVRDNTVLPVGLIYEGDGHTCDVYVQHPRTGKAWRPELTVWIDVRSHYIVGWYLSEAESAHTTLYALSRALHQHNHVPAMLHVDPGSGFVNKMITGEAAGFCRRLSIDVQETIPGNAKGKGLVEGLFRVFRDRCDKQFPSYCGKDRTDDALRRLQANIAAGKITLPTLLQYRDAVAAYVDAHNTRVQRRLGASPAELWATLERVPTELPPETLIRPHEARTVRRWGVSVHGRLYRHNDLAAHEGREVVVAHDLHDAAHVWIYDGAGRLVCQAALVEAQPWLGASRIEDLQRNRLLGQVRRKQAAIDEAEARARPVLDHSATIDEIAALEAQALAALPPKNPGAGAPTPAPDEAVPVDQQGSPIHLDLYRTDY